MKKRQLTIAITAVLTAVPATVSAQVETASKSDTAKPHLEQVVVNARRTEENLQAVPVAVSNVSTQALEEATVSSMADIQRLVPALQVSPSNTGTQAFVIRGSFAEQFTDPGVITYMDEVPVDSRVLAYGVYDIASVQQLKGPQGTLFGKNSTGGAVLFFSQKPTFTENGYLKARFGNFNEQRFEGAFNVPVTDTVAMRLAGQKETRDGFIESTTSNKEYDDRDNYSLRGSLLWTPSHTFENLLQITDYHVSQRANPNLLANLAGPCTGVTTPAASCLAQPPFNAFTGLANMRPYLAQQQALDKDKTVNNFSYPDRYDYDGVTNITTFDFGVATLKNILYYGQIDQTFGRDYDGTPSNFYAVTVNANIKNYYDELQLFGKMFNDKFDWRVGAVYSYEKKDEYYDQMSFGSPGFNNTDAEATSKALFGQVSYDLSSLLDGVKVTAGYRKTWDNRKLDLVNVVNSQSPQPLCNVPGLSPLTPIANCNNSLDDDWNDYNYNLTVDWTINPDVLVYAATRRGYKSGGFNTSANDPRLVRYVPETVTDIELGLKSDWMLGQVPLRVNAAVYEAKYEDIQAPGLDVTGLTPAQVIFNKNPLTGESNEATFKGYEIEMTIAPTVWWDLSAFYSYVEPKWDTSSSSSGRDRSGEKISQKIPKTRGLTSRMSAPAPGDLGELIFTASYFNSDPGIESVDSPTSLLRREQFDARLDLNNIAGSGVDVGVYGKNLLDHVYCDPTDLGLGAPFELCSSPREYGIEIGYRFGIK